MAQRITYTAPTGDTRTSPTMVYTHAVIVPSNHDNAPAAITWHKTEDAADKAVKTHRRHGYPWALAVEVTTDGTRNPADIARIEALNTPATEETTITTENPAPTEEAPAASAEDTAPVPARSGAELLVRSIEAITTARALLTATGAVDLEDNVGRNTGFKVDGDATPSVVRITRTQGTAASRDYFYAHSTGYREWNRALSEWRAALTANKDFEIVSPGPDFIVARYTGGSGFTAEQRAEAATETGRARAFLDARRGAHEDVAKAEALSWEAGLTGEVDTRLNRLVIRRRTVAAFLDLVTARAGVHGGADFAARLRVEGREISRALVVATRSGTMPNSIGGVFEHTNAFYPTRSLILDVAEKVTEALRTLSTD